MTSIQSIKVSIVHLCSEVRRDVTRLRQQATDLAVSGSSQGQLKHSDTMLCSCSSVVIVGRVNGGTVAAASPPFRPSDPALCGSCPVVTPY